MLRGGCAEVPAPWPAGADTGVPRGGLPELAIVTCNQRETEGKKYIRRTVLDTVWTVPGFVHLMTDGEMWVCDRIVSDVKY